MITKALYLDLQNPGVRQVITVSQYDSGLRAFEFRLLNGSQIYQIPSNVTITLQGTKPDRNGFVYSCSYTSSTGTVMADCTEQMTAVAGEVLCQLILVDSSENRIGTFVFIINVEKGAVNDETIVSTDDIKYVEDVLNRLQSGGGLIFDKYASETIYLKRMGTVT